MRSVPNGGWAAWSETSSALVVNGRRAKSSQPRRSSGERIPAAPHFARSAEAGDPEALAGDAAKAAPLELLQR